MITKNLFQKKLLQSSQIFNLCKSYCFIAVQLARDSEGHEASAQGCHNHGGPVTVQKWQRLSSRRVDMVDKSQMAVEAETSLAAMVGRSLEEVSKEQACVVMLVDAVG